MGVWWLRTRPLSGGSFQDALQPASGLAIPGRLKLVPFKLQSWKDPPDSGLFGAASTLRKHLRVGAGYLLSGMSDCREQPTSAQGRLERRQ